MRKTIRVNTSYLTNWMRRYYFDLLDEQFEFIEDTANPEYVLIGANQSNFLKGGDHICHHFLNTVPESAIRIYLQHEAVGFDTTLYDYAVLFTDDLKLDDRVFFANFFSAGYFEVLGDDVFERLNQPKEDPGSLLAGKTAFCNFVYSHAGVPEREQLFKTLSGHRRVESHGKLFNNINPEEKLRAESHFHHNWFEEGIDLKRNSKFSIASENALHPRGYYVSEKIVTAMLADTIPIYWGNPEIGRIFNRRAFINCHDYASIDDVLERVVAIDQNDELWCEIMAEPWLTPEQYLEASGNRERLKLFLANIFSQTPESARRRPRGFWAGRYENAQRGLLRDAVKYRDMMRIDIPALQQEFTKRLAAAGKVWQIEALISATRALKKRVGDERWEIFLEPETNPAGRFFRLAADSAASRRATLQLAIAFFDGDPKSGIACNREFSVRRLRDLVEKGLLQTEKCPSKAYLYWGMVNMNGEAPMVTRNPQVAAECFAKIADSKVPGVRNLALYHLATLNLQENELERAFVGAARLIMNSSIRKSQLPLLVDVLGQQAIKREQRKFLRASLQAGNLKELETWNKLLAGKLPWGVRRRIRRFVTVLEQGGYFPGRQK